MSTAAMRSIPEWCGVCLQDDLKKPGAQVIAGVPLCKGCASAFADKPDILRDAREFLAFQGKPAAQPALVESPPQKSARVMSKADYVAQFGPYGKSGLNASSLQLWEELKALPFGSLMILPVRADQNPNCARSSYLQTTRRLMKVWKVNFTVKLACNYARKHVVIEKLPL